MTAQLEVAVEVKFIPQSNKHTRKSLIVGLLLNTLYKKISVVLIEQEATNNS